jgi:hypothetical protein
MAEPLLASATVEALEDIKAALLLVPTHQPLLQHQELTLQVQPQPLLAQHSQLLIRPLAQHVHRFAHHLVELAMHGPALLATMHPLLALLLRPSLLPRHQ